ncbi:PAS domain S-box protein [Anatilimnocola floriformis]|uniref:PAS domain S-box protein n=1 Tax=Anatilimnocola floriformis TaxID=2948575 RepID=UPI0020C55EFD|nr:PAS domain S-box protein [Anatilimnocola floriformis]
MYQQNQPDPDVLRQRAKERWDQTTEGADFASLKLNDAAAAYVRQLLQKQVELEWQVAEEKRVTELLSAALNGVPDTVFVKNLDGVYLLFNEAAAKVAGRSCDEIIGRDDRHLFGVVESEQIIAEDRAILKTFEPFIAEQELGIGGEARTFSTVKSILRDKDGTVQGIVGIARDITAIRQAQNELSESEKRFRTLADNLPDNLYLLDPDDCDIPLKILYANKAAAENDGYVVEQLIGRSPLTQLDTPETAAQAIDRVQRALQGEVVEFQAEHVHRLGYRIPYEVRAVRIPWQSRTLVLGICRNITARLKAEEAQREHEARLAEAQEIGGLGSFEIDLPAWRGHCSPALCKIFGFENDQEFHDYNAFIKKYRHPDDHEPDQLMACATTGDIEQRFLHPSGETRTLHVRRKVIRNAIGIPTKLIGTVQDVTDRRKAEDKLRASEARYRTFVDHVSDAMFLHHADATVLDVNQQACDSLGLSREELIGKTPIEFDPAVTVEQLAALRATLDAGESLVLETQHRRKDGSTFPVEIRGRPFWVDGERFSISLAHDITARKKAEQALRASEQRFRELADAIPQIVFTAGPDGGLTHTNARATQYAGVKFDELTGWSWADVIHPDDLPSTLAGWKEILTTGVARQLEFRIRRADGEYRWHIARQIAGRDAEGNITQWYGTCTDIEDMKQAEHALRSSEERYRKLFDSIPDPMFVYDPRTLRCLTVNDAAVEKYGYARFEFAHLTINDIRLVIDEKADQARHRKKNGDAMDVEITAHELELDGRPVMIALVRDVTDRLQAEADLRRTTELLRVVAEGTPDAVFVKDLVGRYLLFNPAAARFVGKPAAEVLGNDDFALFDREGATIVREGDLQVIESQRVVTTEETLTAAGVTRTYLAMKAPYRDGNGQVVGTIGISRDITERKRAEEAYRKISALHQTIIHTATEGICLCTPRIDEQELEFSVWNEQMTAITGYTRDDINRAGWFQVMFHNAEQRQAAQDRTAKLLLGQTLRNEEWEIVRKDGDRRVISFSTSVVGNDENGQPLIVALAQDITDRRRDAEELARRQAELRHASRLNTVGQMVAALTHEVAQPLAAISNFAASSSALLRPEPSKKSENLEQVRRHIEHIDQQSRRAADIIHRLRDYSRKSATRRVPCDLNALLRTSVEMVSLELRGAEVNLSWDLAADLPFIAGDPIQLQQVIINLLLNARDSLLESGAISRKIALRSRADLGAVIIEVEDNGSGMSDEIAGRLYEPFVTTKPQGMGIGLNICRSILQDHRGVIDYHQVATGGVLFRISLPLTETIPAEAK